MLEKIYYYIFPNYVKELKRVSQGCSSLLDVGCGNNSPVRFLPKKINTVGIDIYNPAILVSKKNKIHRKYFCMNVLDIDKKFPPNSFDLVVAFDIIEHLSKKNALRLIKKMQIIARKKVVILTPNGFLAQSEVEKNQWQKHLSGFKTRELEKLGFKVYGANGWKPLKGVRYFVTLRPKLFWLFVSAISQIFVRNFPNQAFGLLAIKDLS